MADDRRRERARWHCRRGMLELDLMLAAAFERHYDALTEPERDLFDALLSLEDTVLMDCLQGVEEPTNPDIKRLVEKIRQ